MLGIYFLWRHGDFMSITPVLFPELIQAIVSAIEAQAEAVTELDQILGDGDHVINLQRGLQALKQHENEVTPLDWCAAWQKIGMTLMSSVGGASGSLYATLFISLSKHSQHQTLNVMVFADCFQQAVEAVKQRGKSDLGEKTLLDVLIPVSQALQQDAKAGVALTDILTNLANVAAAGAESTRELLATKGRASFLGERSRGYIDAGAKTAQLMIEAIVNVLGSHLHD